MPIDWRDFIEVRRGVLQGKVIFKGTRLAVAHILRELATGMDADDVLAGYPQITRAHLQAAFLYTATVLGMKETDVT